MKTEKCKHYYIHKWGEPPTEPDENGTVETENQCKIKKGNSEVFCNGDLLLCEVLINKQKIISLIDETIRLEKNHKESTLSKGIVQMCEHAIVKLTELRGRLESG